MRPINRSIVSAVVCFGLSAVLVGPASAENDSQMGVWKLNAAQSKYSPGPKPTSATTTIVAVGAGTKVSVDQTMRMGRNGSTRSPRTTTARTRRSPV